MTVSLPGGGNNGVPVGATLAVPDVEVTVPADVEVGITVKKYFYA